MKTTTRKRFPSHHTLPLQQQHLQWKRKYLIWLLLAAGVLCIILPLIEIFHSGGGMVGANNTGTSLTSTVTNTLWTARTQALLENTHRWNGTYSGDFAGTNQHYDPYTTYYAILTYQALKYPVPAARATINAITSAQNGDGRFPCEEPTQSQRSSQRDVMSCIYYNVMSLKALGTQPHYVQDIIQHINALQTPSGLYAFNADQVGKLTSQVPTSTTDILATRQALTILNTLGGHPQRQNELIRWLVMQWGSAPIFTRKQNFLDAEQALSLGAAIGDALNVLHIHLYNFPNASSRLHWVLGLRDTALTLTTGQKRTTDMFVINDWLNLLTFLTNKPVQADWLGERFSRQILSTQQISGGYNVFFDKQADIQGTYLALNLLQEANHAIPRISDILALLSRQVLANGGFAPVYQATSVTSDMFSTALSLALRALLGSKPLSSSEQSTLKDAMQSAIRALSTPSSPNILVSGSNAEMLYSTISVAQCIAVDSGSLTPILNRQIQALRSILQTQRTLSENQLVAAYYLSLSVRFDHQTTQELERDLLNMYTPGSGFGIQGIYNLQITWLILGTLNNLRDVNVLSQQIQQQLAQWIYQHQTPQGGYQERGISYVTGSYYAVESLRVLNGGVTKYDPKLLAWLWSLKLPSGGIRQAKDPQLNTPDLEATYQSLLIAQQMSHILPDGCKF